MSALTLPTQLATSAGAPTQSVQRESDAQGNHAERRAAFSELLNAMDGGPSDSAARAAPRGGTDNAAPQNQGDGEVIGNAPAGAGDSLADMLVGLTGLDPEEANAKGAHSAAPAGRSNKAEQSSSSSLSAASIWGGMIMAVGALHNVGVDGPVPGAQGEGPAHSSSTSTEKVPAAPPHASEGDEAASLSSVGLEVVESRTFLQASVDPRVTSAGAAPGRSEANTKPAAGLGEKSPSPSVHASHLTESDVGEGRKEGADGRRNPDSSAAANSSVASKKEGTGPMSPFMAGQPMIAATPTLMDASSVSLSDLPGFISAQADSLVAKVGSQGSNPGDQQSGGAVKELTIALHPGELGSMSVKMRLSNGELAVVIEAEKPDAVQAITSESQSIKDRLASSGQVVSSIVVRESPVAQPQSASASGSGGAATGSNSFSQQDAQGNSAYRHDGQRKQNDSPLQNSPRDDGLPLRYGSDGVFV